MLMISLTALVLLIAYNLLCLLYFKKHFPAKRQHWIYYVIAILINIACSYTADLLDLHRMGILAIMASFMLELKLLFKMDLLRILHGGGAYILIIYSSRGITVSVFSIILRRSVNDLLQQDFYYYIIASIAFAVAIGFTLLVKKIIAPDEKIKPLFPDTRQMKFIVSYQFAILIYIILLNDGRFSDRNALWFSILYLTSFLITMGLLAFIWSSTVQLSRLLEYELNTKRLQEQLDRQVSHYKSYKKFTESYRIFKHDYNNMMSAVKTYENEKAINLLDEIHDTMQKNVQMHKKYSDNVLLDAILQDAANTCEDHNIKFSATLHMSGGMVLSDLNIVLVSNNILNNAIEACEKVPYTSDRFIEINGSVNPDWSFIEISNSFSGEIKYHGGELVTSKKDKDYHGYGLMTVKKIIEDVGGMVLIDVNQEKRIFTVKLHIPRN
jgi:hypothetical protein